MRISKHIAYIFGVLMIFNCTNPIELFDFESSITDENSIGTFSSTSVFEDKLSDEVWCSKEADCITMKQENEIVYSGNGSLHITWDKISSDCPWLGMGFGWDGWSGKNFANIYEKSAIQFKIRSAKENMKSLPVAFCMEDYGNVQAWTGFNRSMLADKMITTEWTTVTIPMLEFNWEEFEADITNIKQFMIQFEAAGDVYIDDMKIVEHKGSLKKRIEIDSDKIAKGFSDRREMDFEEGELIDIEGHKIKLEIVDNSIYLYARVLDTTPMENAQDGDNIWNGDGIEMAFSTNKEAMPRRKSFLVSDQQIGIRMNDSPMVWNYRSHKEIMNAKIKTNITKDGYEIMAAIPIANFGIEAFEEDAVYGLEIAINTGTRSGREVQWRWNSPDAEGHHKNPSLWGEMIIKPTTN